ncbi:MAG: hypothetical protein ACQKBY_02425 [Verrucomicrobiales bacterium]
MIHPRQLLPPLAALLTAALPANPLNLADMEEPEDIDDAVERIPDGANLRQVTIPAYDENLRPTSLVTAGLIIKKNDQLLDARDLRVIFFKPDATIAAQVGLSKARFHLASQRLDAEGHLVLSAAGRGIITRGNGGIFKLNTRRGFIHGPVDTLLDRPDTKTPNAMTPTRPRQLAAALPLLLAFPHTLTAAPPTPLTTQELIDFERAVAPAYIPDRDSAKLWEKITERSSRIDQSMLSFLTEAGLQNLTLQTTAPAETAKAESNETPVTETTETPNPRSTETPATPPLISQEKFTELLTPGENRFTINATKGAYFDGTQGHLVYLGNVTLRGRGITMTCNRELKAIFNQPEAPKEKKATPKNGDDLFGDFKGVGDLKEIIISGQIEVTGKNEQGQPMGGRADNAVYNAAADRLILRGGTLVFRNGDQIAHSNDPNAYAAIRLREQSVHLDGKWNIGLPTTDLKPE